MLIAAVPGPSADDGLYKWNDCFHPVEEKGDRGGVNLINKQNRRGFMIILYEFV